MSWWILLTTQTVVLFAFTTLVVSLRPAPSPMGPALILSQASALAWALGELLALQSPDLATKHLAVTLLHSGGLLLPLSWLLLAIRFAEAHGVALAWAGPACRRLLIAVTGAFLLVLFTNRWHGLYLEPVVRDWNVRGPGWHIAAVFCYAQLLATLSIYLTLLRSSPLPRSVRRQAGMLSVASAAPLLTSLAQWSTGPHPYPVELGVLGGGIGGLLILALIYRDNLFDLSRPVVSAVLEQDPSALLVFDESETLRFASAAVEKVLPESPWVKGETTLSQLPERLDPDGNDPAAMELVAHLREGGPVLSLPLRCGAGSSERWLWCDAERIVDRRGRARGTVVRLQDLAALQTMEARRRGLADALASAERLARLGSLSGQLARQIREPVDEIRTQALRGRREARARGDGPWLDDALDAIALEAKRSGDLVRGAVRYAREESRARDEGADIGG